MRYHFRPGPVEEVVARLRGVQFDPLRPLGCNHDLVLQARVPDYRIDDWRALAYDRRTVYDGWDKQACLLPFSAWSTRRIFHKWHAPWFERIFDQHPHAVEAVLAELEVRGPLLPKEFAFQERKAEWQGSWFGPSVTKQTLRALWHTGKVMTHSRRGGHHVYDLAERLVPPELWSKPPPTEDEALRQIVLDRHHAIGILSPTASQEVWTLPIKTAGRRAMSERLVAEGEVTPVEIDGLLAQATPELLAGLDEGPLEPRAIFIAPLDQLMWDRKLVQRVFGFDYIWEVYKPAAQRKWGYYVLPVLYGDRFVARFDAAAREGVLHIEAWHWEPDEPAAELWPALEAAFAGFADYLGVRGIRAAKGVDRRVLEAARAGLRERRAGALGTLGA